MRLYGENRTIIKGLCEVSESGDGRGIDIFLGRQHAALGWNGNGAPGPHNGWWEVSWNHGASFVSPADDDFSRDMKVIGRIRDNAHNFANNQINFHNHRITFHVGDFVKCEETVE